MNVTQNIVITNIKKLRIPRFYPQKRGKKTKHKRMVISNEASAPSSNIEQQQIAWLDSQIIRTKFNKTAHMYETLSVAACNPSFQ
jgi:hypothetical protein